MHRIEHGLAQESIEAVGEIRQSQQVVHLKQRSGEMSHHMNPVLCLKSFL